MAREALFRFLRWTLLGVVVAALVACASEPPPLSAAEMTQTRLWTPQPVPAAAKPAASSPPITSALPSPVRSGADAVPAVPTSSQAPYSPAVAARFPEPPVHYGTPAFQPGRSAFTTNEEMQAVLRFMVDQSRADGTTVKLLSVGTSQRGVPMEALLFTRNPDYSPAALVASGRPTVLVVGQQHGDEPAGSEALLVIAGELAHGHLEHLLDRINVVLLPRANPDGAFAGRRLSSSGIDINRDHLLLRTPEAQAQAQLARDYQPAAMVDLHEYGIHGRYLEKFGAVQRFDALLQYATTANMDPFISKAAEAWFRQPLVAALDNEALSNEWYYTTSSETDDHKVAMGSVQPDNGRNVNGLRNAVSFVVESRGVGLGRLHFKRRVFTQVTAVSRLLQSAFERAADLAKLHGFVDAAVAAQACKGDAVVLAQPTPSEYGLLMIDPQTGADRKVTVSWDSALELNPVKKRSRPCGYWLSAKESDAVRHLRALGLTVRRLDGIGEMRSETYSESAHELQPGANVADGALHVEVTTTSTLLDTQAGGYYVPLDQPLANLAIAALEPDTPDSFVAHRIISTVENEARVMLPPDVKMSVLP